jgi:hypothetical protein
VASSIFFWNTGQPGSVESAVIIVIVSPFSDELPTPPACVPFAASLFETVLLLVQATNEMDDKIKHDRMTMDALIIFNSLGLPYKLDYKTKM